MIRLVDPERLHGNPFRPAVRLIGERIPLFVRIRFDVAAFRIDFHHAVFRADVARGRRGKDAARLRNRQSHEVEIVAERLDRLKRRSDLALIGRIRS